MNRRDLLARVGATLALPLGWFRHPHGVHRLDQLHDALAATWGPAIAAQVAHDAALEDFLADRTDDREAALDRAYEEYRREDRARHDAYWDLAHAIKEEAGVGIVDREAFQSYGRPFAVVRTPLRIYAVGANCGAEWWDDGDGCHDILAIDL